MDLIELFLSLTEEEKIQVLHYLEVKHEKEVQETDYPRN